MGKSLQNRSGKKTEAEFWEIYETFLYVSEKEILNSAIQKFKSMPQDVKESYKVCLPDIRSCRQ